MSQNRIAVLFVCLGNICRSPAAEGTFAHIVNEQSLQRHFRIDSCGTSAYHIGEPANRTSQAVARQHGIHLPSRARQFQRSDFAEFDYIFAMDRSNYSDLEMQVQNDAERERLWLFRAFDPEFSQVIRPEHGAVESAQRESILAKAPGVPDPYYGGRDGFEQVQQMMMRTSENLLHWLRARHNLA